MSNNYCVLTGNLGADVEMRFTQSGTPVANFRMATTDRWTRNGEQRAHTEWHRCVAWRKQAEKAAEMLSKGTFVRVTGNIRTRSWEDREGQKRFTTEIHVFKLEVIGKKTEKAEDTQPELPLEDANCPF